MYENGNRNGQNDGPVSNVRGLTARRIIVIAVALFACSALKFGVNTFLTSIGMEPVLPKIQRYHRNRTAKQTEIIKTENTAIPAAPDPEAVNRLREKCYDENCGLTCVEGVCTVERIYPGTDIQKKTFYTAAGKPERMDYCLKKDRYGICAGGGTAYYRPDGRITSLMKCIAYDTKGICLRAGNMINYIYDEKGNIALKKVCSDLECRRTEYLAYAYDELGNATVKAVPCSNFKNGKCESFGKGDILTYDAAGRKTSVRKCEEFNPDLSCAEYSVSAGQNWKYDEKGNKTYFDSCTEVNAKTGICTALEYDIAYTYGSGSEPESAVYCVKYDGNGDCTGKENYTYSYEYDDKGNISNKTEYLIQRSTGTAGDVKKLNYVQLYDTAYDRRGHKTHVRKDMCGMPGGNKKCIYEETFFDENDRNLRSTLCSEVSDIGECRKGMFTLTLYDDNGILTDTGR